MIKTPQKNVFKLTFRALIFTLVCLSVGFLTPPKQAKADCVIPTVACYVQIVNASGSPAPTSSPGGAPLVVPANASAAPYSATNPLPVTTPAPSTTGAPGYTRIQDGTTTNLAVVNATGALSGQLFDGANHALFVAPGAGYSQGNQFTNGYVLGAASLVYFEGAGVQTTANALSGDAYTNPNGPIWVSPGGRVTTTIAAASAGPNVIKATAGRLSRIIITTAGTTGTDIFYDNASACSGTIIAEVAGTTALSINVAGGVPFQFDMPAANGITECGGTGSAAVTVSYF